MYELFQDLPESLGGPAVVGGSPDQKPAFARLVRSIRDLGDLERPQNIVRARTKEQMFHAMDLPESHRTGFNAGFGAHGGTEAQALLALLKSHPLLTIIIRCCGMPE